MMAVDNTLDKNLDFLMLAEKHVCTSRLVSWDGQVSGFRLLLWGRASSFHLGVRDSLPCKGPGTA